MHKIKFRCWDKKEKLWLNSFSIHSSGLFSDLMNGKIENGICIADANWIKISEKISNYILMRYIGIEDKNGIEIYEGDIVKQEGIKSGCYYNKDRKILVECCGLCSRLFADGYYSNENEVIGNIYQNPDLLTA